VPVKIRPTRIPSPTCHMEIPFTGSNGDMLYSMKLRFLSWEKVTVNRMTPIWNNWLPMQKQLLMHWIRWANLLTHSDLFAAGIARSGAYNRSLTPFGFQSEERSYWDAPDVYDAMSPFMHADKMKTPLLLVHGEADNNSGTHTMQSERYFQALKSFGAPVRLVILPLESHGYTARENVFHLLWEQDQWLEKYVKNKVKKEPQVNP